VLVFDDVDGFYGFYGSFWFYGVPVAVGFDFRIVATAVAVVLVQKMLKIP
jgi:hypothetical protein